MSTVLVAVASFVGFLVAYHTYGRWLSRRIFALDADARVPSRQYRDDVDYVPTPKEVVFGHHFTSIAGTGPIVGPAIAVFWGWLPALIWVVFGSIFVGAVHDFGALVVSLRNRGETVGQIAGRIISPRARILFLTILFFALMIVLAIFGLVIAQIFTSYPESVLSVWIELPLALLVGFWVHRKGHHLLIPSLLALVAMYAAIYLGVYYFPLALPKSLNPVMTWTAILFVYCFFASVLPVWVLLQPRDFINSHELLLALALLVLGMLVAGLTGRADLAGSAPAVAAAADVPLDAPPVWPFLFITIACGAVSGFHCLVSSGTSSKQIASEPDAKLVGYGAMLLEGALAVVVILACCAGVGMGKFTRSTTGEFGSATRYVAMVEDGSPLVGRAAWQQRYDAKRGWRQFKLVDKVGAFIEGGGNFLASLGLPLELGIGMIAVLVASFAATTLDTATRLQRYVVQELAATVSFRPLQNKYTATLFALATAGVIAVMKGAPNLPRGTGGLLLWPLFGATNQMLAGLAFLVTAFYLWRRSKPVWFMIPPMLLMIVLPAWALVVEIFGGTGFVRKENWLLAGIGTIALALQVWLVVEALLILPKARGVLEEALPEMTTPERTTAAPARAADLSTP